MYHSGEEIFRAPYFLSRVVSFYGMGSAGETKHKPKSSGYFKVFASLRDLGISSGPTESVLFRSAQAENG